MQKNEQRMQMNVGGDMLTEKDGDGRNIVAIKRINQPSCGAQQIYQRQFLAV